MGYQGRHKAQYISLNTGSMESRRGRGGLGCGVGVLRRPCCPTEMYWAQAPPTPTYGSHRYDGEDGWATGTCGGLVGVGGAWEAGWGPCADPCPPERSRLLQIAVNERTKRWAVFGN